MGNLVVRLSSWICPRLLAGEPEQNFFKSEPLNYCQDPGFAPDTRPRFGPAGGEAKVLRPWPRHSCSHELRGQCGSIELRSVTTTKRGARPSRSLQSASRRQARPLETPHQKVNVFDRRCFRPEDENCGRDARAPQINCVITAWRRARNTAPEPRAIPRVWAAC